MNEQIRINKVRVIDESHNQVGIINTSEAVAMARQAGLDLVEVSPTAEPPVCRIMDYGKWQYEQKRKNKQSQKKHHQIVVKGIRLRPKIDKHDLNIKIDHAIKFIEKGNKVQFTMLFRGREMTHVELGHELMDHVLEMMQDCAKMERPAKMLGRRMTMIVTPL